MKRKEEMTLLEKIYVIEAIKGLFITGGHLIKNFFSVVLHFTGLSKNRSIATIEYPDEKADYPERFRGRHRLTIYDDGRIKCTSCYLCATACPANCIYIEAEEHPDSNIEKFPGRFEIDTLLCVYCGYCVEACPVDAIRMDTGIHPNIYGTDPRDYIEDRETLLERSRIIKEHGKEELVKRHMDNVRHIEQKPFDLSSRPKT